MNLKAFKLLEDPSPKNVKDWPYYQKYMGTCMFCSSQYSGPKRSFCCWECVSPEDKRSWLSKHDV